MNEQFQSNLQLPVGIDPCLRIIVHHFFHGRGEMTTPSETVVKAVEDTAQLNHLKPSIIKEGNLYRLKWPI